MDKIGRRQLLKGGAGGALALGAVGLAAAPAFADDDDDDGGGLLVHVHGNLMGYGATPPTVRLAVSFEVFGRADSLAGAGWDGGTGTNPSGLVPGGPPPGGPVGACYYTASGSLEGRTLTLVGRSLLTNRALTTADTEDPGKSDTRADGRDFNATVNVRTGEVINWSLSPMGATFKSDPANPSLVMVTGGGAHEAVATTEPSFSAEGPRRCGHWASVDDDVDQRRAPSARGPDRDSGSTTRGGEQVQAVRGWPQPRSLLPRRPGS